MVIKMNQPDFYSDFLTKMIEQGSSALIIQGYEEVNRKLGVQWEASRSLESSAKGDKFYSIIEVGSKPIDLKSRTVGATGGGVIARMYKIETSDYTAVGGDNWHNLHAGVTTQPESKLYSEDDVTFVTPVDQLAIESNKVAADVFAITNAQNQGKGVPSRGFGSGRTIPAGTVLLLELESFDSSQTITALVEMYEGELDYNIG